MRLEALEGSSRLCPRRGMNGSVIFKDWRCKYLEAISALPCPVRDPPGGSDLGPQGFRTGILYRAANGVVDCGPFPGDGGAGDVLKEPRSDPLQEVRLVAGWGEWGGQ